ncbi:hypothetical protein DFH09DRAFT_1334800 [Mycena vulgaris]|nr:hypothetical protein DFH09DRAFT_1334800 [Mycena vulgaris]
MAAAEAVDAHAVGGAPGQRGVERGGGVGGEAWCEGKGVHVHVGGGDGGDGLSPCALYIRIHLSRLFPHFPLPSSRCTSHLALVTCPSSSSPTPRFPSTLASRRGLASASPPHLPSTPNPLLCVVPSLPPPRLPSSPPLAAHLYFHSFRSPVLPPSYSIRPRADSLPPSLCTPHNYTHPHPISSMA